MGFVFFEMTQLDQPIIVADCCSYFIKYWKVLTFPEQKNQIKCDVNRKEIGIYLLIILQSNTQLPSYGGHVIMLLQIG